MEQETRCRLLLQKIIACELSPGSLLPTEPAALVNRTQAKADYERSAVMLSSVLFVCNSFIPSAGTDEYLRKIK